MGSYTITIEDKYEKTLQRLLDEGVGRSDTNNNPTKKDILQFNINQYLKNKRRAQLISDIED